MNIVDSIDQYLSTLTLSTSTRKGYKSVLLKFARWMRRHGYYTLATAAKYFELDLKRQEKYQSETILSYVRIVHAFCKWAADNKTLNVFDMAQRHAEDGSIKNPPLKIEYSDLRFISNQAKRRGESGLRGRAMLFLAVTCGLNPDQIAAIMPDDVMINDFDARVRVPRIGGGGTIEIDLTRMARQAIIDYIVERGPVPGGLPFIAVTTTKSNRQAMTPAEIRKCIVNQLRILEIDYCDAICGDSERLVASYIGQLSESDKQELASHAARLYYDHMKVKPGYECC